LNDAFRSREIFEGQLRGAKAEVADGIQGSFGVLGSGADEKVDVAGEARMSVKGYA